MTTQKTYTARETATLADIYGALDSGFTVKLKNYVPTLPLRMFERFITNGQLVPLAGQYCQGYSGRKCRFLTTRNTVFYAAWAQKGDDFENYTTRFQRAHWRHTNAHKGIMHAIRSLPDTVPAEEALARLKAYTTTGRSYVKTSAYRTA